MKIDETGLSLYKGKATCEGRMSHGDKEEAIKYAEVMADAWIR